MASHVNTASVCSSELHATMGKEQKRDVQAMTARLNCSSMYSLSTTSLTLPCTKATFYTTPDNRLCRASELQVFRPHLVRRLRWSPCPHT